MTTGTIRFTESEEDSLLGACYAALEAYRYTAGIIRQSNLGTLATGNLLASYAKKESDCRALIKKLES